MRPLELLDTNVLLALRNRVHPARPAVAAYLSARREAADFVLAPQSLYEAWVVMTRPIAANGYGFSPQEAYDEIDAIREPFRLFPDPPMLLDEWIELCRTHAVSGKNAHDARLAAWALLFGVERFVTLNARDFARYGLNVVVP